jgi:hypothetical protein
MKKMYIADGGARVWLCLADTLNHERIREVVIPTNGAVPTVLQAMTFADRLNEAIRVGEENKIFEFSKALGINAETVKEPSHSQEPYVLPAIQAAVEKAAQRPAAAEPQVGPHPDFPDLEKAQFDVLSAFVLAGGRPLTVHKLFVYLQKVQDNYTHLGINWLLNRMRSLGYVTCDYGSLQHSVTWQITDAGVQFIDKRTASLKETADGRSELDGALNRIIEAISQPEPRV